MKRHRRPDSRILRGLNSSKHCMVLQAAEYLGGYSPAFSWENGNSRRMVPDSATALAAQVPEERPGKQPEERGGESLTGIPQEISEESRAALELAGRARAGDTAAFSALIGQHEGKIFRLAMNITQNREDAEDVLQEAFL